VKRIRRSTLLLVALFVATTALWLLVRPAA